MTDPNFITGVFSVFLSIPILYAYLRIALAAPPLGRHMSVSLICIVASYALRTNFWDVLPPSVGIYWPELRESAGGNALVNSILNALFCYGLWRGLRALQLMVPQVEQHRWSVWQAWRYPARLRRWFTHRWFERR